MVRRVGRVTEYNRRGGVDRSGVHRSPQLWLQTQVQRQSGQTVRALFLGHTTLEAAQYVISHVVGVMPEWSLQCANGNNHSRVICVCLFAPWVDISAPIVPEIVALGAPHNRGGCVRTNGACTKEKRAKWHKNDSINDYTILCDTIRYDTIRYDTEINTNTNTNTNKTHLLTSAAPTTPHPFYPIQLGCNLRKVTVMNK